MKTLQNEDMKWIAVDLDGTLAMTQAPDYLLEYPIEGAVEAMQQLDRDGWKIVIYTARHWADYQIIEDWCQAWNIPARRIICGKLLFRYFIDDRNIAFEGDWKSVVDKIGVKIEPGA
jgi:hypothetical protein